MRFPDGMPPRRTMIGIAAGTVAILILLSFLRFQIEAGAGGVYRLDRLTGQVVICRLADYTRLECG